MLVEDDWQGLGQGQWLNMLVWWMMMLMLLLQLLIIITMITRLNGTVARTTRKLLRVDDGE
jgi:uncharacterized protein involved in cysteine biosynthesis